MHGRRAHVKDPTAAAERLGKMAAESSPTLGVDKAWWRHSISAGFPLRIFPVGNFHLRQKRTQNVYIYIYIYIERERERERERCDGKFSFGAVKYI